MRIVVGRAASDENTPQMMLSLNETGGLEIRAFASTFEGLIVPAEAIDEFRQAVNLLAARSRLQQRTELGAERVLADGLLAARRPLSDLAEDGGSNA